MKTNETDASTRDAFPEMAAGIPLLAFLDDCRRLAALAKTRRAENEDRASTRAEVKS